MGKFKQYAKIGLVAVAAMVSVKFIVRKFAPSFAAYL